MVQYILRYLRDAFRKCDLIRLLLMVITTVFGCFAIASDTNASAIGPTRYLVMQIVAATAGVVAFVVVSSIDANFFSEHRPSLVIFNTVLLFMLIPFGTDNGSGNRSWLNFPFLPFDIQPAEICKITFILIMASVMASRQNNLSFTISIAHMILHLGLLFGINVVISGDLGVYLIFACISLFMTIDGSLSGCWDILVFGTSALLVHIQRQLRAD